MSGWRKDSRDDPLLGAYNGFSQIDRHAATAHGDRFPAARPRHVPPGMTCAVCCQEDGVLYWHAEDYRMPLDTIVVCPWCHWFIHNRYKHPGLWLRLLDHLADGCRPLPAERGTAWHDWRRRYRDTPAPIWPMTQTGGDTTGPLVQFLPLTYLPHVPPGLRIAEGSPHLPTSFQWRTDPPIHFTPEESVARG
jgi:hypothetical protein